MTSIFNQILLESISFSKSKRIGIITDFTSKYWKKIPSDFTYACQAAGYYAKKFDENMLVVPSTSYGRRIFHVIKISDDLSKYTPGVGDKNVACAMVEPDGSVYQGTAHSKN